MKQTYYIPEVGALGESIGRLRLDEVQNGPVVGPSKVGDLL